MKYYGVLAERFCKLKKEWEESYNDLFAQYYATVHRLETNKLRNVAKMFGHLMHTGKSHTLHFSDCRLRTDPKALGSEPILQLASNLSDPSYSLHPTQKAVAHTGHVVHRNPNR
jgi:pre-mRNA-splicing factor CWC22